MRFIKNGPDFPHELLKAQEEGKVVFFCGAGVSRARSGLPNFIGLVKAVIEQLGAQEDSRAYKLFESFRCSGYPPVDAVFTELEKEFFLPEIQSEVAQALKPSLTKPDLSAHDTLLRLASQRGVGVRLVTTNFDLLFEKASNGNIPCHTPNNLFNVRDFRNEWGIVHLHGRVNKEYDGAENLMRFVLTSNEFGAAYLAHGWARDFVSAILEDYFTVFIGYSADDPPINYLLRGMAQPEGKKPKIFAFDVGDDELVAEKWKEMAAVGMGFVGRDKNDYEPLWESLEAWAEWSEDSIKWRKNIFKKAILGPEKLQPHERGMIAQIVNTPEGAQAFADHEPPLPSSWLCVFDPSIRYFHPASYNGSSHTGGEKSRPQFEDYCLDTDKSIEDTNQPPPTWNGSQMTYEKAVDQQIPADAWDAFKINENDIIDLEVAALNRFQDGQTYPNNYQAKRILSLISWINKVADSELTIWWCARQDRFGPLAIERVFHPSPKRNVRRSVRESKALALQAIKSPPVDETSFSLIERESNQKGWSRNLIIRYVNLLLPRLQFAPQAGRYKTLEIPPRPGTKYRWHELVNFTMEYPREFERDLHKQIPVEYLKYFIETAIDGLHHALEMEKKVSGWVSGFCFLDREEGGGPIFLSNGLYWYISIFMRVCQRLHDESPTNLSPLLARIPTKNDFMQRAKIWLCSFPGFAPSEMYIAAIVGLRPSVFWDSNARDELSYVIKRRWSDISFKERQLIEKKIKRGNLRNLNKTDKKNAKKINASQQIKLFTLLKKNDCELTFDLDLYKSKRKQIAPFVDLDWEEEVKRIMFEMDEESGPTAYVVEDNTDPTPLMNIPLDKVIQKASEIEKFSQGGRTFPAPFIGLISSSKCWYRRRAVGALHAHKNTFSEFPLKYWRQLLEHQSRSEDANRTIIVILSRLLENSGEDLSSISFEICAWLEKMGPRLYRLSPDRFDRLWTICMDNLNAEQSDKVDVQVNGVNDFILFAYNSPAGRLANMLLQFPKQNTGQKAGYISRKFISKWKGYVRNLVSLPGTSNMCAMILFARTTDWFYSHDRKFATEMIIDYMTRKKNNESMFDAAWSGFFWNSKPPKPDLFDTLKPMLLIPIKFTRSPQYHRFDKRAKLLLWGWCPSRALVSSKELRTALLKGGTDFQINVLNWLSMWTSKKETKWPQWFPRFMKEVWPRQRKYRTAKASTRLVDLVLGMSDNIEAATQAVLPYIVSETIGPSDRLSRFHPENQIVLGNLPRYHPKNTIVETYPREALQLLYALLPPDSNFWDVGIKISIRKIESSKLGKDAKAQLKELKAKLG